MTFVSTFVVAVAVAASTTVTQATERPAKAARESSAPPAASAPLPTGACHITAASVSNCTSAMTRRSCLATATRVGGVADWKEGQRCP
jgi:hypothetical protein